MRLVRCLTWFGCATTIRANPPTDHFDRIAMHQIVDEFSNLQRELTVKLIETIDQESGEISDVEASELVEQWCDENYAPCTTYRKLFGDLNLEASQSIGKLTLAQ